MMFQLMMEGLTLTDALSKMHTDKHQHRVKWKEVVLNKFTHILIVILS